MSRFRRSEILVGVEADRVVLVRHGRDPATASVEGGPGEVYARLAQKLAEPGWRGGRARVVLADSLVHFAVLERPQGLANAGELLQAIRSRVEEIFGERTPWSIEADLRPFARRDLVCCTPAALIADLRAALAAQKIAVASLQPQLIASYNRWCRQLASPAWFVTLEARRIAIALVAADGWRGVSLHGGADGSDLATLLARARLQFDEEDQVRRCYVVAAPGAEVDVGAALELKLLTAAIRADAPDARLALAGASQ